MAYQVIARKWRPQSFEEVVFQDHVSRTIRNGITGGRIPHAYLFSGPRGVGKTTMARILARALNCEKGPTPDPCGVCRNCVEIRADSSFDVIEIDGASNNGVENIRELREKVNFAPVRGRYKVYIIDEVHMVSTAGFNALLKTLEEPPPHVVFIFATTEIHRIPETILSRCQKFFFKKIPVEAIVEHLVRIVEKEGYRIPRSALYPIARASAGGMRDAQSLLDQVISFSGAADGEEIGEGDALAVLGIVPLESFARMVKAVLDCEAGHAMGEVHRIVEMGVDIPRYAAGLVETIRLLRLAGSGIVDREILGMSSEELEMLKELAGQFHDEELSRIFRIATDLVNDLRFFPDGRIPLEMALLDMIAVRTTPSLSALIQRLSSEGKAAPPVPGKTPPAGPSRAGGDGPAAGMKTVPPGQDKAAPASGGPAETKTDADVQDEWRGLIRDMEKERQYQSLILKESRVNMEDGELVIRLKDYYTRVVDREVLAYISGEMSRRMGRDMRIVVRSEKTSDGDDEAAQIPSPQDRTPEVKKDMPAKGKDPAVEKIRNVFHGEIIDKGEQ